MGPHWLIKEQIRCHVLDHMQTLRRKKKWYKRY